MKRIFLSTLLILAAISLKAQNNYYRNNSGTITGNGYTYKYETRNGEIALYNANNLLTTVEWAMKDGSVMPSGIGSSRCPTFEKDGWTRQKAFSIVNAAFTASEKVSVKGKILAVEMKIDSSTGKISEIEFLFANKGPFTKIPPETFYKIEQNLRSGIWFTPTAAGKKLNYIVLGWNHEVE